MADLHEVSFHWPSGEPTQVIVTGTFDQWSSSLHLHKSEDGAGFSGSTKIEYGSKIAFKYVVDSEWLCSSSSPTETDGEGNINNIYQAPDLPATALMPTEEANGSSLSQLASDLVDTVAARDGSSRVPRTEENGVRGRGDSQRSAYPPTVAFNRSRRTYRHRSPVSTQTPSIAPQITTPSAAAETPSADEPVVAPKVAVSTPAPVEPSVVASDTTPEKPEAAEIPASPPGSAATPSKSSQHAFPSSETPSPTGSPSKFGTASTRKNRKSIFGKIRNIFSDKEEKEKK
ncbi:hypothetical protein C8F01DRAFT_584063 [Mycena amicta]|nr:hypothetical protein C8F01DRAFT_584063 [Mycena amicta]